MKHRPNEKEHQREVWLNWQKEVDRRMHENLGQWLKIYGDKGKTKQVPKRENDR